MMRVVFVIATPGLRFISKSHLKKRKKKSMTLTDIYTPVRS